MSRRGGEIATTDVHTRARHCTEREKCAAAADASARCLEIANAFRSTRKTRRVSRVAGAPADRAADAAPQDVGAGGFAGAGLAEERFAEEPLAAALTGQFLADAHHRTRPARNPTQVLILNEHLA